MRMQTVADLLLDCLDAAPDDKRHALANALEEYSRVHWRSWLKLQEVPAAALLLEAIVQGVDARPGRQELA